MQARLEQHKEKMAQWSSQLPTGTRVAFGTSREQLFNLHTRRPDRQRAGFSGAERSRCDGGRVHAVHRLEQLLAVNPAAAGCPLSRREHC